METKISIAQFLFNAEWKVLSDALNSTPALPSQKISSASDLLDFCAAEPCCLIMVYVASKEDLIQLATFFKTAKKTLKGNLMKVVVVNASENKQFEKAIGKLGAVDILEMSLTTKALRFKLDFWMKAMRGQAKKMPSLVKSSAESSSTEQSEGKLAQSPALDCESDIWLLTRESDCKRIIGRWMVKLMGPSPYVGSWNEVPNKKNVWIFQIKKSFADSFINGEGNWFFSGEQKPEFNWRENRWMFTGDEFELFFHDGKVHSRVKLSKKVLSLAANSMFAQTKEQLIVESFDKEVVFKNEAENLKDPSQDFENEGNLGGHLEGKVEKEESKKGHLEGKVKEKEDAIGGHLEGKQKNQEGPQKNLEGIVKELESSKGPLKGELKGTASVAEQANPKNKKQVQSEESSDSDHKQHNEKLSKRWGGQVTEYEKQDGEDAQKQKKNLTEHLESQWGGKIGPEAIATDGNTGPGSDGVKEGNLLDLKKSEKEHQTHYRNHNKTTQYEAAELHRNQYKQEDQQGELGGKTSTDHLASHYGNGQGTEHQPTSGKGPLEGSHETEKVSTHFGGRRNIERPTNGENEVEGQKKSPPIGKDKTEKSKDHDPKFYDGKDINDKGDVLPFIEKKSEDKELEKLTENATVVASIIQGPHKFECTLDDYFDNNVIFLCKGEGLKNSEAAVIDVGMHYRGEKALINCQGIVMSLDQDGNGGFFVTIEVAEKDVELFDNFMGLMRERQESINTFLKKAAGK